MDNTDSLFQNEVPSSRSPIRRQTRPQSFQSHLPEVLHAVQLLKSHLQKKVLRAMPTARATRTTPSPFPKARESSFDSLLITSVASLEERTTMAPFLLLLHPPMKLSPSSQLLHQRTPKPPQKSCARPQRSQFGESSHYLLP